MQGLIDARIFIPEMLILFQGGVTRIYLDQVAQKYVIS